MSWGLDQWPSRCGPGAVVPAAPGNKRRAALWGWPLPCGALRCSWLCSQGCWQHLGAFSVVAPDAVGILCIKDKGSATQESPIAEKLTKKP